MLLWAQDMLNHRHKIEYSKVSSQCGDTVTVVHSVLGSGLESHLWPPNISHGVRDLLTDLRWSARNAYCLEPFANGCSVLIMTTCMHP